MSKFKRKDSIPPLCACGCGKQVTYNQNYERWNTYIHGHYCRGRIHSKEHRRKIAETLTGRKHSIETRLKISKSLAGRKAWNKGQKMPKEQKAKISKALIGKECSVKTRLKMAKAHIGKKSWNKGKPMSENQKIKIGMASLGRKHTKESKLKMSLATIGSNNPAWKGGRSFEPYCHIWTDEEYKESIRKRDNYECQNPYCRKNCNPNRALSLHHIDGNKKNCPPWNFISLCCGCNTRAEGNKGIPRIWWQNLYQEIMTKKYGYSYQ